MSKELCKDPECFCCNLYLRDPIARSTVKERIEVRKRRLGIITPRLIGELTGQMIEKYGKLEPGDEPCEKQAILEFSSLLLEHLKKDPNYDPSAT